MEMAEEDGRLELDAALATYHPDADWIHDVARQIVWGHRTSKDLIGLINGGAYVMTL